MQGKWWGGLDNKDGVEDLKQYRDKWESMGNLYLQIDLRGCFRPKMMRREMEEVDQKERRILI